MTIVDPNRQGSVCSPWLGWMQRSQLRREWQDAQLWRGKTGGRESSCECRFKWPGKTMACHDKHLSCKGHQPITQTQRPHLGFCIGWSFIPERSLCGSPRERLKIVVVISKLIEKETSYFDNHTHMSCPPICKFPSPASFCSSRALF